MAHRRQPLRGTRSRSLRQLSSAPSPVHFESKDTQWNRIAFDGTGTRLGAVDRLGTLVVFDLAKAKESYRIQGIAHSVEFDRDGKHFVILDGRDERGRMTVHDSTNGNVINTFHAGQITTAIALHPDGAQLLTGALSGDIQLWSIRAGKRLALLTARFRRSQFERSLDIQHGIINDIAFSPDGQFFAVAYEDGVFQLWDISKQSILLRGRSPQHGPATGICFSPNGKRIAVQYFGGNENIPISTFRPSMVAVWDCDTSKEVCAFIPHEMEINPMPLIETAQATLPFGQFRPVFSHDGARIFTTGPHSVRIWDAETGNQIGELVGHDGMVLAVASTHDGALIAGAGAKQSVRVWQTDAPQVVSTLCSQANAILDFAIDRDGGRMGAVCESGQFDEIAGRPPIRPERRTVCLLDLPSGQSRLQTANVEGFADHAVFSLDGHNVLCGNQAIDLDTTEVSQHPRFPLFATRHPSNVRISSDEQFAVRIPWRGPAVQLLRAGDGATPIPLTGHTDTITAIAISPDNQWIATGGNDNIVRVWASSYGTLAHTLSAHSGAVTCLDFNSDASRLASGGADKIVHVWDTTSGLHLHAFQGHSREISALAFSPTGSRLASGSGSLTVQNAAGGEVVLWNLEVGLFALELKAGANLVYSSLVFAPDGTRLYAAANQAASPSSGRIVYWSAPEGQ